MELIIEMNLIAKTDFTWNMGTFSVSFHSFRHVAFTAQIAVFGYLCSAALKAAGIFR